MTGCFQDRIALNINTLLLSDPLYLGGSSGGEGEGEVVCTSQDQDQCQVRIPINQTVVQF